MKRILALALIFSLLCTTAFATGKTKEKQTMDDVVNYAKSVAKIIAYTADDPITGAVEEVVIGGKKVKVHSEFKYAMDVYYAFYKDYFECVNSMDLAKLTRMTTLAEQAEQLDVVLEKIDDMDLSDGDMAYYMEVYSEIMKLIGGDFSSTTPSSSTGGDDFDLNDLSDLFDGFGF